MGVVDPTLRESLDVVQHIGTEGGLPHRSIAINREPLGAGGAHSSPRGVGNGGTRRVAAIFILGLGFLFKETTHLCAYGLHLLPCLRSLRQLLWR